jgi:hypothetical protein
MVKRVKARDTDQRAQQQRMRRRIMFEHRGQLVAPPRPPVVVRALCDFCCLMVEKARDVGELPPLVTALEGVWHKRREASNDTARGECSCMGGMAGCASVAPLVAWLNGLMVGDHVTDCEWRPGPWL